MRGIFIAVVLLICSLPALSQNLKPCLEMEIDFARNYHFWERIKDRTWEVETCESDSFPFGARYHFVEWSQELIPGFHDLSFWLVKKFGSEIIYGDHISPTDCGVGLNNNSKVEYFLLARNSKGNTISMSGDIMLNEIRWYLLDLEDYEAVAMARMAYLLPKKLKKVRENAYSITFSADSGSENAIFFIQILKGHIDQFQIWQRGSHRCPLISTM